MRFWSISFLFLLLYYLVASCSSDGCDLQTDANLKMTLYESDADLQLFTDSITVYGTDLPDSLIYELESSDHLLMQLDPGTSSSSFVIINGTTPDTVIIIYSSQHHFLSKACGYTFFHTIGSVEYTKNRIDTILIIDPEINIYDKENLRTFY